MKLENDQPPPDDLRRALIGAGQEHVLRFWVELDSGERERFASELRALDLAEVAELQAFLARSSAERPAAVRRPAEVVAVGQSIPDRGRDEARRHGERLLAAGRVGLFLVAGGQGTRLGYDGPKGCLPVGPLSGKTLFELHAEKIARLRRLYGAQPPWYIMTSEANDAATREFFARHASFGLGDENVYFVRQRMIPALDDAGRLILESRGALFRNPNGHGGAYRAFRDGGALADARRRGIEHIFYFQVDNPLIRIADPLFLGLHALSGSEYSLKVLAKTGPEEKVGVVAVEDERPCVIEYSDLSPEEAQARDATGRLRYWAGTIAIHFFSLDFFARVAEGWVRLPLHIARKKIPSVDEHGCPRETDGNKFESFIFDSLPHAGRTLNLEVIREEEFAPIKNRTGVDSLETARALLSAEHRRWLQKAGIETTAVVEISPRVALDAEDLRRELAGVETPARLERDVLVERDEDGAVRFDLS